MKRGENNSIIVINAKKSNYIIFKERGGRRRKKEDKEMFALNRLLHFCPPSPPKEADSEPDALWLQGAQRRGCQDTEEQDQVQGATWGDVRDFTMDPAATRHC